MRESILVVDDDVISLKLAGLILSQQGYEVHKAKSGMDAINYLRRNKVDLILLDIKMPMMSGIKALGKIRNDKAIAHTPVIFLTASADVDTVTDACRLEPVDYIKKPFQPHELLERVRKAL